MLVVFLSSRLISILRESPVILRREEDTENRTTQRELTDSCVLLSLIPSRNGQKSALPTLGWTLQEE